MWKPDLPYNELPFPPVDELETHSILRAAANARAALAGLDQAVKQIPNPEILISPLSLLEAQASSEIENIVTTTDDLFRDENLRSAAPDPAVKETLRYREALFAGLKEVRRRPLNTNIALEVSSHISGYNMEPRSLPGTFIGNPTTLEARYTPPEGKELIARKLGDWEKIVHIGDELDPLVAMAVAHYQFEAIHPFTDSNGRTGRILNILMLIERRLLSEPVLYLSRYIIENKNEYYDRLLAVTRDDAWHEWLSFMLSAVHRPPRRRSQPSTESKGFAARFAGKCARIGEVRTPTFWTCSSNGHTAESPTSKTPATSRAPRRPNVWKSWSPRACWTTEESAETDFSSMCR